LTIFDGLGGIVCPKIRSLRRWPGPLRKTAEPALKDWLTEQINEASSVYTANDRACLLTLLKLMLDSGLNKWSQYAHARRGLGIAKRASHKQLTQPRRRRMILMLDAA
jgi:hypothetical protein